MNEPSWTTTTLTELADSKALVFSDGYRTRADQLAPRGIPILRAADVANGIVTPARSDHIRPDFRQKIGIKTTRARDVVLTTKGTVGRAAMVQPGLPEHAYSPQLCFFRVNDGTILDAGYLYGWIRSNECRSQLLVNKDLTDMAPYVNLRDLGQFRITLPPLSEQQRIAGVLGVFDDLIETNWQTADALAQLAALAFKRATTDQPEATLGDLLSLAYGKALPAPRRNPGPVPVVSSAGITGCHDEALVSGPGVVVGRKGTVGSVTWVPTDFYPIDTAFYAESDLPPEIVYHLLAAAGLSDLNSDSAVPGLNRERALSQPSPDIRGQVAESIQVWLKPLMSGADELRSEAKDLARQRDELLPLLISGRVRVSEVEGVA